MSKRLLKAFLWAIFLTSSMLLGYLFDNGEDKQEFFNFILHRGLIFYVFIVIFVLYLFFTSKPMKKLINATNSWAADFALWKMTIIVICMLIGISILATVIIIIPILALTV
jgi:hypothetical protein